jgi:hypothetical protein
VKYSKPYARHFEAANVSLEDGPQALEVLGALLVFASGDSHYVRQVRDQLAPLRAAIAAEKTKPIAVAILAMIRSTNKFGPKSANQKWVNDIREFWSNVEGVDECLRGLDAVLTLARGNHTHEKHCVQLIREAKMHRDTLTSIEKREPKREIRAIRSWGKREAREIEFAAMMYWSDGEPLAPDWEVLGEPRPTPRTTKISSSKFPLPWEQEQ